MFLTDTRTVFYFIFDETMKTCFFLNLPRQNIVKIWLHRLGRIPQKNVSISRWTLDTNFPRMLANLNRFSFSVTTPSFAKGGAVVGTLQDSKTAPNITFGLICSEWCEWLPALPFVPVIPLWTGKGVSSRYIR